MPEKTIEIDLEESQKWPEEERKEWHWCLDCKNHYHGLSRCVYCGSDDTKVTRESQ
jgi:hypothetical protein